MPDKPRCTYLTRRGRPCRNPAMPGIEPPVCAVHRRIGHDESGIRNEEATPGGRRYLPGLAPSQFADPLTTDPLITGSPPPTHLYFPRPTAAEMSVLAATAGDPDLRSEIGLARVVLLRLMAHLQEELPPEELRRVAGLIFTGARTVAMLLGKRPARPDDTQQWLAAALAEMGEMVGREL